MEHHRRDAPLPGHTRPAPDGVDERVEVPRDPDRRPEPERTNDVVEDVEPRVHR